MRKISPPIIIIKWDYVLFRLRAIHLLHKKVFLREHENKSIIITVATIRATILIIAHKMPAHPAHQQTDAETTFIERKTKTSDAVTSITLQSNLKWNKLVNFN